MPSLATGSPLTQPVVLVSVDDFVAAVRAHADRLHDLARRTGCAADAAAEVVEASALDLLDALLDQPEEVGDLVGWWFAHGLDLARRVAAEDATAAEEAEHAGEDARSVLAGTEVEARVRAAIGSLPERERMALTLRDAYDLSLPAVAVALRRPADVTASLLASARLHLMTAYDGRRAPTLDGHTGRQSVDGATLAMFVDGSLPAHRATVLSRHLQTCPACEEYAETLLRARRLSLGLPVIAMDDDERTALVERVDERAGTTLPSLEEVLLAADVQAEEVPLLPMRTVVAAVVGALVLGVLIGALTAGGGGDGRPLSLVTPSGSARPSGSVTSLPVPGSSPGETSPSASAAATSTASQTSPPATASPSGNQQVQPVAIVLQPESGPNGTEITVLGSGWVPGREVRISYENGLGTVGATATAIPDADGTFQARLAARDPAGLPGRHTVVAEDGEHSRSASFTATT